MTTHCLIFALVCFRHAAFRRVFREPGICALVATMVEVRVLLPVQPQRECHGFTVSWNKFPSLYSDTAFLGMQIDKNVKDLLFFIRFIVRCLSSKQKKRLIRLKV